MQSDNVDGLLIYTTPAARAKIMGAIAEILGLTSMGVGGMSPWGGSGGVVSGGGMTLSIVKYLGLGPGDVRVGLSVSTDSVGME